MKARVHVTLKNGVLDPQGKAVHHALQGLGFDGVNDVRQGKFIELELDGTDAATRDRLRPGTYLVVDVTCRQHWLGLIAPPLTRIKPSFNTGFSIPENLPIFSHLKCSSLLDGWSSLPNHKPTIWGISALERTHWKKSHLYRD